MLAFRSARRLALPLLALVAPAAAGAQALDYAAFETLFGEAVTASAIGKPQRAGDVPAAMHIITAEQIRRSGAHDIPTVLARYTSLDVQRYGATDHSVGVRGLTTPMSPRLLVLVDGRQVYIDDYGRTSWESIPVQLAEIRQIEVVRGPNSALYGFNAVAGVVNIVTFDPATDRVNSATTRIGTGGYRELSAVATAPAGGAGGVRLSAGLREQAAWTHTSLGPNPVRYSEPSRYQLAANGQFRLADAVRLGLDASFGRNMSDPRIIRGATTPLDERIWSLRARLGAETAIGLVEANLYHNGQSATLLLQPVTSGVTVAQLSDTVKVGATHTLRPSVEWRRNEYENATGARVGYDVAAAGLMWNWAVTDGLEATLAGRWDQLWMRGSGYGTPAMPDADRGFDRSFGTFAWNAGLVWRPTELDAVRLTSARGIGSPSLVDLGIDIMGAGIRGRGNPGLNPTVVDNVEIGWRRQIAAIDGHVDIAAFHEVNRNLGSSVAALPQLVPGMGPMLSPVSLGTLTVNGIELSGAGRLPHGFDWGVEYRLAAVRGELLPLATVDYRHSSPRHLVSARLGWEDGPLRADLFLRYASMTAGWREDTLAMPAYVTINDYAALGGRLAYRITDRATLALEGADLLHGRQTQSLGFQAQRQVFISLRVDF